MHPLRPTDGEATLAAMFRHLLADLGHRAWLRGPVDAFIANFGQLGPRKVLVEMVVRLAEHVAICLVGQYSFQIAVPLLDPMPWLDIARQFDPKACARRTRS